MVDRERRIARAQPDGALGGLESLLPSTAIAQRQSVIPLRQRKIRIELQRRLEFCEAVVVPARREVDAAERGMRPRVLVVGHDRRERGTLGDRCRGLEVGPAQMDADHMGGGQQCQRLAVIWVDRDRFGQQGLGEHVVGPRDSPVMR